MLIKRHGLVYSFRAMIDEQGSNVDRYHDVMRAERWTKCLSGECNHITLWDLNWCSGWNIVRLESRRSPFRFSLRIGPRYHGFTVGRH